MELQKVLYMNGGDGEASYAKNSSLQSEILGGARSVMREALLDLYQAAGFPGKLTVADLGCSSGPNALTVVADVVDTVWESCRQHGRSPPEFQLFLNDLPGNDFNSVFGSIEAFYEKIREGGRENRRCFVAGVPGSFYGRLFPSRSIHFFHSSTSIHWLSQGYIEEEKVDSFNLPYYAPSAAELESEIQNEGSFSLKCLEIFEVPWEACQGHSDDHGSFLPKKMSSRGQSMSNCVRAISESLLERHFDGDVLKDLFSRYSEVLEERLSREKHTLLNIVMSLVRKP